MNIISKAIKFKFTPSNYSLRNYNYKSMFKYCNKNKKCSEFFTCIIHFDQFLISVMWIPQKTKFLSNSNCTYYEYTLIANILREHFFFFGFSSISIIISINFNILSLTYFIRLLRPLLRSCIDRNDFFLIVKKPVSLESYVVKGVFEYTKIVLLLLISSFFLLLILQLENCN